MRNSLDAHAKASFGFGSRLGMTRVRGVLAGASALVGMIGLVGTAGCSGFDTPPPAPFFVYVKVESDPGTPLPGATVSLGSKLLATAGYDGRAMLTLNGSDGEITNVTVKCPDTYQAPLKATAIKLTRVSDPKRVPEYLVLCPPMMRHMVVAIRAENGADLPVRYLGNEVAHTDASGAAHFSLDLPPGGQFQVTLDTSANSRVKPVSPSRPFTVGQLDEMVVFEQRFTLDAPPRPVYHGPVRVAGPRRL